MRACSITSVQLFTTPQTIACQASLPWDSSGKNTGVGCHALLQGIFLTQGSNLWLLQLLHCRRILYRWATGEAPWEVVVRYFVDCPLIGIYLVFSWLDWGYRFGGVGPRRVHTICILITVDVDLDHLAVGGFIRCLHYKALPPSPLLPALCSWTEVAMCSTQLRSGGLCSTSLRVRYFHKLFGIGNCIFHERIKLWFSLKMAGWISTLFPMKMLWKWE